ncbi:MAG: glycosyltransferase family 4 protein [Chloroflexi bacterium]|nr:glycosyltransferase family 4 protein [Chloroflexota bacterium]
MNIVMVGPFGMAPKQTMRLRALPLARALAARGHRVTLLLPPWSNPDESGRAYADDGVQVVNVPLPPLRIPGLFHIWLALTLVRRALALHPAVVHGFKPKAYAGLTLWLLWYLRRLGIHRARLVVDSDDWEGAGGWNEVEPYPGWLKRFFAWQEWWGLAHADTVTVASRALETLVWALGVPRTRVCYAPNGVWPTVLSTEVPRDGNAVLLYTRFFEFDLGRVARLLATLSERHATVRYVIAGKGFRGEENELRRLLAGTAAEVRVDWRGWVEPAQLPRLFAEASLAIYPFDDTLLNRAKCAVKLTELLDAAVPVVAEAVGQNREYIVDGVSGLLVPPGDGDAFAEAVLRMLNDRALSQAMGAAARERMQTCFRWEAIAAQLERHYAA